MTQDVARRDPGSAVPHGLLEAKLLLPRHRPGMVHRTRVLRRLRAAGERRVVSFVAPPGYGKTSVLVQWATRDRRPVAWLTADDGDNDPVVFLTYLAAAIDRLEPLDPGIFDAIASPAVPDRAVVGSPACGPVGTSGTHPPCHRRRAPDHQPGMPGCPCRAHHLPPRSDRRSRSPVVSRWPCPLPAGAPTGRCSRSAPTSSRWTRRKRPRWPPDLGSRCRRSRRRS